MKKIKRILLLALIILFYFLFVQGWIFKRECHGMWDSYLITEWAEQRRYPEWLPPHMRDVYDIVYSIKVKLVPEEPNKDVWQSPAETRKNGGDCEDWAIFVARKLLDLGYTIEPITCQMYVWGRPTLHMWVRVYMPVGCCMFDAWDVDLTIEPRIFEARFSYKLRKEDADKFWDKVMIEE